MGIRLHKTMGYGLINVQNDNGHIADERFDSEGYMMASWEDKDDKWTLDGFYQFLKNKAKSLETIDQWDVSFEAQSVRQLMEEKNNFDFYSCFIHQSEYGLPEVFMCIPICQVDRWHRRDDALDYIEENHNDRPRHEDYYRVLDYGLYPWTASFWDKRDGRELNPSYARIALDIIDSGDQDKLNNKALKKELGFNSAEEVKENIRPAVPNAAKYLLEYCRIFKDMDTMYELQPISYTFWA